MKKVKSLQYNWHQAGSTIDRDGAGQNWDWFDEGRIEIFSVEVNPESVKADKNGCEKREYPCR